MDDVLKELVEIRAERRSFVPYERERTLRKREKELWSLAERWHLEKYRPEEFAAKQAADAKEAKRIAAQNSKRKVKKAA